jgi:hypothetical protein
MGRTPVLGWGWRGSTFGRPRPAAPAPAVTVTFRSPRTGAEVACFEHQSPRQVERLLAQPPEAAARVACTVEVRAAA